MTLPNNYDDLKAVLIKGEVPREDLSVAKSNVDMAVIGSGYFTKIQKRGEVLSPFQKALHEALHGYTGEVVNSYRSADSLTHGVMSTAELLAKCRISEKTLDRAVKTGKIVPISPQGAKKRYFRRSDVAAAFVPADMPSRTVAIPKHTPKPPRT